MSCMSPNNKGVRKLSNGDRVGTKLVKDRAVLVAEVMRTTEIGEYNGFSLQMNLDEARALQESLAQTIALLEAQSEE